MWKENVKIQYNKVWKFNVKKIWKYNVKKKCENLMRKKCENLMWKFNVKNLLLGWLAAREKNTQDIAKAAMPPNRSSLHPYLSMIRP